MLEIRNLPYPHNQVGNELTNSFPVHIDSLIDHVIIFAVGSFTGVSEPVVVMDACWLSNQLYLYLISSYTAGESVFEHNLRHGVDTECVLARVPCRHQVGELHARHMDVHDVRER
jgi:hypothetical protein